MWMCMKTFKSSGKDSVPQLGEDTSIISTGALRCSPRKILGAVDSQQSNQPAKKKKKISQPLSRYLFECQTLR